MSRSFSTLAAALTLALAAVPFTEAKAAKPVPPPPPPQMVGAVWATLSGNCTNLVAVDDAGRVLAAQCYATGFVVAAQLPGIPVSLHLQDYGTSILYVGLASGDVYRCDTRSAVPWPFEFMGNVFALAGGARVPDFPSLPVSELRDPATTEDDTPAAVRPGAEK